MNSTTASPHRVRMLPPGIPAAARTALKLLQRLEKGSLTVQLPDGSLQHFGHGGGPAATLTLRNWKVFGAALKSGDILSALVLYWSAMNLLLGAVIVIGLLLWRFV